MTKPTRTWVRWLDEIADGDLALAGGKALYLARLRRAGFETPKGFVIDTAPLRGADQQTRPQWLPPQAQNEILGSYRQLGAAAVAVRSSATVEDSSTRSFAGQGRTVLNVQSERSLLEAVQSVLSSADAAGLRGYAQRAGIAPDEIAMHVVVQEMVDAESAGVLFTVNPVAGNRNEMVINATWGLGDPLVSGKVTPDQITVDKSTGHCISYVVGGKEEILTSHGSGRASASTSSARCLDPGQIRRLLDVAREIETHFDAPQDIEWAWRNKLYILQTRPLTTAPEAEEDASVWRREIERLRSIPGVQRKAWVASGIAELLPCPTPLSWEVASRFMSGREGYGLAHRRLGYDPAPGSILERIAGHTYVDLDREIGLFFQHAPLGYAVAEIRQNPLRAAMPQQVFQWRKLSPGVMARLPALLWRLISLMVRLRRLRRDYPHFLHDHFLPEFDTYVRREREADYHALSAGGLADLFERRLHHFLHDSSPVLVTGSILAAMSYRDVEEALIDRLGNEGIELTQRLLTGLRPNPTLEIHETMARLARGEASEREFLDQFGHRCGHEFELAAPRWRENGAPLGEPLARPGRTESAGRSEPAENQSAAREAPPHITAERRFSQLAGGWGRVRREFVRSRLDIARRLFPLRELTKNYLMMEYELLRGPLVELDRRLGFEGGIFYLRGDEIRPAVHGQPMRKRIHERRHEHQLHQKLQLPRVILGDRLSEAPPVESEAVLGDLKGIGVSSGTAVGPVRVLHSIEELATLGEDEIAVVPSLDVTWTTVFARAAGLVAQRGAILSHGAILAREFKLPAIVNVPEISSRLRNGQPIKINGTTGTIQILDRALDRDAP